MDQEYIEKSWMLGDDSDCETCGWSYNELRFEEWPDDEYMFITSIGCYGGANYDIDDLNSLFDDISGYEDFTDEVKQDIIDTVAKYKEKKINDR